MDRNLLTQLIPEGIRFPEEPYPLTVVGTGLKPWEHVTLESLKAIVEADRVYFAVGDVLMEAWLEELNPNARRLPDYLQNRPRRETYEVWVQEVLGSLRQGYRTCAVTYGHPGVLVQFTHEAIRLARAEGYRATMLPGISTEACLLCDLLVDPGVRGLQSYSAAVFLRERPRFDIRVPLMLWQLRVVAHGGAPTEIDRAGLEGLSSLLSDAYGWSHEVVVYEASRNPAQGALTSTLPLAELARIRFRRSASLYVPPLLDPPAANASQ